jgi:membrane-bound lytic murein transglycosylase F
MMLTQDTAKLLGVDRLDPVQSIDGGARYVRSRIKSIPKRITGPDRLWMALAAYNIGSGHLEDARIITQKQGGDPDKWIDVKERLPLLSKTAWFTKTKHGYARGMEPVIYVDRIRTYYDILTRVDEEERSKNKSDALELSAPAI